MESLYLETSLIGHLTSRFSSNLVTAGHQQLTRDWWRDGRAGYRLFVSVEVIREVSLGDPEAAAERLSAIRGIPVLANSDEISVLAAEYQRELEIPEKAKADAFHLAYAVVYGMDYIATWNLTHIANPHVVRKFTTFNLAKNLVVPLIVTPEWLTSRKEKR